MAEGYNFTSGASAFGNSLQQLLAQRKIEARQAMLDEVAKRQIEAGIENQRESTASLKAYREAQAQEMKDAAEAKFAGTLRLGQQLDPESVARLDPSHVNFPRQRPNPTPPFEGAVPGPLAEFYGTPTPDALIPGALQPPDEKDVSTFRGSPQEQEDEDIRQRLRQMLRQPEVQSNHNLRDALMYRLGVGEKGGAPPAGMFTDVKPDEIMFDQDSKKFTKATMPDGTPVVPGSHITVASRPPQPSQFNSASPVFVIDPVKGTVTQATSTDSTGKPKPAVVPAGSKTVNLPTTAQKPVLDESVSGQLAAVFKTAKDTSSWQSGTQFSPEVQRQLGVLIGQAIASAGVSDAVRENLYAAISNPEAEKYTNQQLAAEIATTDGNSPLSPEDQQAMLIVLNSIRPGR